MNKLSHSEIEQVRELAVSGKTPTETSKILNRSISPIGKLYKKLGFMSRKQMLMNEQMGLKGKGLRRCYICKQTFPLDSFRLTFESQTSRTRACRSCERKKALERHNERMKTLDLDTAIRYKLYQAKSRTKKKNYSFSITHEDVKSIWIKQDGKCFYTGIEMTTLPNNPNYFSIDRYDSSKGYQPDNIVLCCHVINIMKKDMVETDFVKWCRAVVDYKNQ